MASGEYHIPEDYTYMAGINDNVPAQHCDAPAHADKNPEDWVHDAMAEWAAQKERQRDDEIEREGLNASISEQERAGAMGTDPPQEQMLDEDQKNTDFGDDLNDNSVKENTDDGTKENDKNNENTDENLNDSTSEQSSDYSPEDKVAFDAADDLNNEQTDTEHAEGSEQPQEEPEQPQEESEQPQEELEQSESEPEPAETPDDTTPESDPEPIESPADTAPEPESSEPPAADTPTDTDVSE